MKPVYPTRNGLIISPYELGYTVPTEHDVTNLHHGQWPWAQLNGHFISATFGSIITNTFRMIPSEHNIGRNSLHHRYSAPRIPSFGVMIDFVDQYLHEHGQIDCVKHKGQTVREYVVTAGQWQRGRNG